MIDQGVAGSVDFYNSSAHVFEFGIKRPNSLTRDDLSALAFLEIWKTYKTFWTDHNPSVTVSLHEDEWNAVGDWVYSNFEIIGGLSFLPYDGGSYVQTPYETSKTLPKEIVVDFTKLSEYESEDGTSNMKELACSAGVCEI
jgi:ribonucleoside-diphosphate reductase alpha chain